MSAGHHELSFWRKYVFSTDHKVIGMQYLFTGIIMAFLGGFLAYVFRYNLGYPGAPIPLYGKLNPMTYNSMVTMHGTIMIFWVAMPVLLAGLGNLLIPLMIGAEDMAFPKLNLLSYWIFFISTIVLVGSFFIPGGAFGGGWTAYPPLSADGYPKDAQGFAVALPILSGGTLWILAVALEFVSMLVGGINFFSTTLNMRAPGMKLTDMPLVIWFINLASLIFMFSVGPLVAGAVMLLLDRTVGTGFYDPSRGGDPILFQHFFWFFGHPEVYVILWPTLGIMCEIITTFSRKHIYGYKFIIWSAIISGFLSIIVWAHHQFIAGINPKFAAFFSVTTIIISIPFAAIIFSFIATMFKGSLRFPVPMLWAIGFLSVFLIGGVTGIYLGSSAFDIYAHDTYFVIAHFHYTLFPIVIFGGMAGFTYWFPKFSGKFLNETLGKLQFWLTFIFFNLTFMPLFFTGMKGEHRRIFNYAIFDSLKENEGLRKVATIATIGLLVTQVLFIINLIVTFRKKRETEKAKNPYNANSLEWIADSPPPHGNFSSIPVVYRNPYEYSSPGRESDFWPQNEPVS
ncbi:MAG: cbb3-type cytochrome c oxidase subunit I [Leptospiraceae bacterium]|nr:cbb3-type cytochrome c oxidase subunit I [Leptospiraceae bacterium]